MEREVQDSQPFQLRPQMRSKAILDGPVPGELAWTKRTSQPAHVHEK